jgi:hypothetical protein
MAGLAEPGPTKEMEDGGARSEIVGGIGNLAI